MAVYKSAVKGEHFAHCVPCNTGFDIGTGSGGKDTDKISRHIKTKKHLTSVNGSLQDCNKGQLSPSQRRKALQIL